MNTCDRMYEMAKMIYFQVKLMVAWDPMHIFVVFNSSS